MNSLIIDEPSLQTLKQRFAYSLVTFLFWTVWIYLWLPVISLVAWLAGFHLFYQEMIVQNGAQLFFDLVTFYGLTILSIGIVFLSWAWYNLARFRGKERRKSAKGVEKADLARLFSVEVDQLGKWHKAKRLIIYHDEEGEIDRVEVYRARDIRVSEAP
jgi:biofilm PGA synthesis protein PgaD